MGLLEQQNLLARLYTDEEFRKAFLAEPRRIGLENGLNEKEAGDISEVMPEELNFFSDSLFWKRLREAEKLLPKTRQLLDKEFESLFRAFSSQYNPQSVKKHLEDAIEFCEFLQDKGLEPSYTKDSARFEKARLEFFNYDKRFRFCYLKRDFFTLRKKYGFALWLRIGNQKHHFAFFLLPDKI